MLRQCSNAPEHAGVAHDRRLARHLACVEETLLVQVREVDEDAALLAALDQLVAPRRQPAAIVPALAVSRVAGLVRREVQEADVPNSATRKHRDVVEVTLERMRTFDPEERADLSGRVAGDDLARLPDEPDGLGFPRDLLLQGVNLLVDDLRHSPHTIRERQRHEPEELCAHAALPHSG